MVKCVAMDHRSTRAWKGLAAGLLVVLAAAQGCDLNPQPLPPSRGGEFSSTPEADSGTMQPPVSVGDDDGGMLSSGSSGSSSGYYGGADAGASSDATMPSFADAGDDAPGSADAADGEGVGAATDGSASDGSVDATDARAVE